MKLDWCTSSIQEMGMQKLRCLLGSCFYMLLMLSRLEDRMNFSSFFVFLLYVRLELVSMRYKSLVSHPR